MKTITFMVCMFVYLSGAEAQVYNITDYGAKADGKTNNARYIQKAIDAASQKGGGTVIIPTGTFMSGSIELKNNITLQLSKGAVLKGIADKNAYARVTFNYPLRGNKDPQSVANSLISAVEKENVTITGEGVIDGNGGDSTFYFNQKMNKSVMRPYVLFFFGCKNVTVNNVTLRNSAAWMQHYLNCDFLRIQNINVFNHSNMNNDGVDIDDCHDVVVSGCIIDADDDALCFKSEGDRGIRNVVVSNCILSSHASAFKMGTASIGGFESISFTNCVIRPSLANTLLHPFKIKGGIAGVDLASVDGAVLDGITINSISIDSVETPIFIKLGKRLDRTAITKTGKVGSVSNISISQVNIKNAGAITSSITGYPGNYVTNVSLRDISVEHTGAVSVQDTTLQIPESADGYPVNRMFGRKKLPASGFYIRHVKNVLLTNVHVKVMHDDPRPAIVMDDVHGADITKLQYDTNARGAVHITAVNSSDIDINKGHINPKQIKLSGVTNARLNNNPLFK
jgi:polygalacturonase